MENPNYYAIIPATVRYDEKLSANAKLLYGEITALTSKEGYCWASNSFFAKLYKTEPRTIQRWMNLLKKRGHIKLVLTGKGNTMRKIFSSSTYDKNVMGVRQKRTPTYDKNVTQVLQENNKNKRRLNDEEENANTRLVSIGDFTPTFIEERRKALGGENSVTL